MDKEHTRARLWAECWMAVASASNCTRTEAASKWADAMLADLDQRFPELAEREKANG